MLGNAKAQFIEKEADKMIGLSGGILKTKGGGEGPLSGTSRLGALREKIPNIPSPLQVARNTLQVGRNTLGHLDRLFERSFGVLSPVLGPAAGQGALAINEGSGQPSRRPAGEVGAATLKTQPTMNRAEARAWQQLASPAPM